MTDLDNKQARITFRDVFFYIVRKWRIIVVVVLACALIAGILRAASLMAMIKGDSYQTNALELYEQAVDFRESEMKRLDREIEKQEKWLENRNSYMRESYLMIMDPDNCCVGSADIQITCDAVSGQISIITGVLQSSIDSGKIAKVIANKYGTESKYIQEVIRVYLTIEEKTNYNSDDGLDANATDGALFHVALIAQDESMAHEMLSTIVDSFNATGAQMNDEQDDLCAKLMCYNENYLNRRVDELEFYQQQVKEETTNVEEYLDSLNEEKEELEIPVYELMPLSEVLVSSIKYTVLGMFVGFIISVIVLMIACLYSDGILSPSELHSRTKMEVYPVLRERRRYFGIRIDKVIHAHELKAELISTDVVKRLLEFDNNCAQYIVWGERQEGELASIIPDDVDITVTDMDGMTSWKSISSLFDCSKDGPQPRFILLADREENTYKEITRKIEVIGRLTKEVPICILYI